MNTLFDIGPVLPEGFNHYPGFITESEELELIKAIEQFDLQAMKFHEYEAKRMVISFGKGWSFTEQKLKHGAFQIVAPVFGRWGHRPRLGRGWCHHQPRGAATI